jgi:tRNA threonylcarbamoyladenosine biosynthesis protein TsaB
VNVLAFDTATPDTVVGLTGAGGALSRRHTPDPGSRPGHAGELLRLAREVLGEAGLRFEGLDRIGVGVGPGTFTGLRIGVATARALAQATGAVLVGVGTLDALGLAAGDEVGWPGPVLAVVDARRGEVFAEGWQDGGRITDPAAVAPDAVGGQMDPRHGEWLAVGDGAVRYREALEFAGARVPADDASLHRVSGTALCRLAEAAPAAERDALLPDYVRRPDAEVAP